MSVQGRQDDECLNLKYKKKKKLFQSPLFLL